jgi:uncharacterized protein
MSWLKKINAVINHVKPAPIELLIIQPTPFCNIDCSYCYLADRANNKRLSMDTLTWLCRRVFSSPFLGKQLTIVWHAGEPLVLPPSYYRQALGIIEQYAPKTLTIDHSIQTNGMLLNDEWITFIAEKNIHIGVSIDGPQRFHDTNRKNRAGRGTFTETLHGILQLQQAHLDFHVITVLTAESLKAPAEFFEFYLTNGITQVCFNIEEIEGPHRQSSLQSAETTNAYKDFLHYFLVKLKELPPNTLYIREISSTVGLITAPPSPIWNHQVEPLAILSMDVDGNLSTFSPELLGTHQSDYNNFVFGNVCTDSLDDMLNHPAFLRTHRDIRKGINNCKKFCAYFPYCGGGAPANKFFENNRLDSHETMYCRLTKKAQLDLILLDLETILQDIEEPSGEA